MVSENAKKIYERLYISQEHGEASPTDVHRRVAKFVASVEDSEKSREEWEGIFFDFLESNVFRPNSPVMMNGGLGARDKKPILSACFVGHLEDDLVSIIDLDKEAAIIFSYGAGIGVNWGVLREKDAPLSSGGNASGPISFMRKLNATANCVKSGGRARRAAIWSGLFDHHPDIEEFIECKRLHSDLSAMNISVVASDEFMETVINGGAWPLISVKSQTIAKVVSARELFDRICFSAHLTGDPGLIFYDRINVDNTTPSLGKIIATNPCGEIPTVDRGSCCLGSLNLAAFVSGRRFDMNAFRQAVKVGVRFLDNIIDLAGYPTPEYEKIAKRTRNIGLGIMGLADCLLFMGIRYGSPQAIAFAEDVSCAMLHTAIEASLELAKEKGGAPEASNPVNTNAFISFFERHQVPASLINAFLEGNGIRNCQWTTIAPTGSISLSADCSQGMEPYFALAYEKKLTDTDQVLYVVAPAFQKKYGREPWFKDAIRSICSNKGSCAGVRDLPEEVQHVAICAHDLPWQERLAMQAALQKYVSAAISSTVNLPSTASVDDVRNIYVAAWEAGLKGITVYRDGSHKEQPIKFGIKGRAPSIEARPSVLSGTTHKVQTAHGNVYLTINRDESGRVVEIFTNGGKNGTADAANLEALARVLSIALQEGADLERLTRTLIGISDGSCVWTKLDDADEKSVQIISIPDAVGKVLARFYLEKKEVTRDGEPTNEVCPECSTEAVMAEGCLFCPSCGWSKCA